MQKRLESMPERMERAHDADAARLADRIRNVLGKVIDAAGQGNSRWKVHLTSKGERSLFEGFPFQHLLIAVIRPSRGKSDSLRRCRGFQRRNASGPIGLGPCLDARSRSRAPPRWSYSRTPQIKSCDYHHGVAHCDSSYCVDRPELAPERRHIDVGVGLSHTLSSTIEYGVSLQAFEGSRIRSRRDRSLSSSSSRIRHRRRPTLLGARLATPDVGMECPLRP